MALSAELKCWLPAAATLPLGGSRDVLALALALDGADRRRHDHQPHHHGARRDKWPSRALLEAIVANLIFGALLVLRSL
jgi:hypothetical protein